MTKYSNEKDVKRDVKKLLDKHNWFWWMPAANGYGATGIADFNAIRGGVFLAVETKFGKNKPTVRQKAYLTSIQSETGIAFVVNEKTLPVFEGWLAAFDRSMEAAAKQENPSQEDGAYLIDAIRLLTAEFV